MTQEVKIGQIWICKQDGRQIVVKDIDPSNVTLYCKKTRRTTCVNPLQFTLRYRTLADKQ